MAEIIDLERFRQKIAADQGFRTWLRRFREQFGPETRFKDVSDRTLLFLATPGEDHLYVFFDLVMGAEGLGSSLRLRLNDLDHPAKQRLLDLVLELLDRSRFEVMRRLGWVHSVPDEELSIIQVLQEARRRKQTFSCQPPSLSPQHPEYVRYQSLPARDRDIFVRRLIPPAVACFRRRVEPT